MCIRGRLSVTGEMIKYGDGQFILPEKVSEASEYTLAPFPWLVISPSLPGGKDAPSNDGLDFLHEKVCVSFYN